MDGLFLPRVQKSHFERRSVSVGRRRCGNVGQARARETRPRSNPATISQRCQQTKHRFDTSRTERKTKATFGVFLFYAFSPLPSNYLFIAYGLTTMELKLIALPFFLGRSVSYTFWGLTSSAVSRHIAMESTRTLPYLSAYFIVSQLVLLYLIYLFTRVDWRTLFLEKKFRLIPKKPDPRNPR